MSKPQNFFLQMIDKMVNINIMSVCKVSYQHFLIIQNQKTRFSGLRELLWPVRLQVHFMSWRNPAVLIVILDCSDCCVKCNLLQRCLLAIWKEQGKYINQHLMLLDNCSSSPCKCFFLLPLHLCFLGGAALSSACLRF